MINYSDAHVLAKASAANGIVTSRLSSVIAILEGGLSAIDVLEAIPDGLLDSLDKAAVELMELQSFVKAVKR